MTSLHDKVALDERTMDTALGEFHITIDAVTAHRAGLDIYVEWSIRHGESNHRQKFSMPHFDDLLVRCGYQPSKNNLNHERVASELLATLYIDQDIPNRQITISFMEQGYDIGNPVTWNDDTSLFTEDL